MSLLLVGCNHQRAGLPVLERLAVSAEDLPKALHSLVGLPHVSEAVVLSTCNRVEVYAQVSRFHPGLQEVRGWLAERGDLHPQDLEELHYSYHDDRAAAHLFAVGAGLDSMVLGERQIALQVKDAFRAAREEGTARRVLQRLFAQAAEVSRRVRRETDISQGASSMVDVGLEAAQEALGAPLAGRRVAIVGAGKMGGLAAQRLAALDVGSVEVWNRHDDKARRLVARLTAAGVTAQTAPAAGLEAAVGAADVVVCTTGAGSPVLDRALVEGAVARRTGRAEPLVLLDLGVPRNVDPGCRELEVAVVDVSDVRRVADQGVTGVVVDQAWAVVEDEAERFATWTRAAQVEPTIRAVRRRAEQVRRGELERLASRLAGLDERDRATVESLTRGIVNTLLHEPTVRLKELADQGDAGQHADALRDLFDLVDPDPQAAGPGAAGPTDRG